MRGEGSTASAGNRLRGWLGRVSGVASAREVTRVEVDGARRSAEINHGLVVLAQRVTVLEQTATTLEQSVASLKGASSAETEAIRAWLAQIGDDMVRRTDGLLAAKAESYEWLAGLDERVEGARTSIRHLVPAAERVIDATGAVVQFSDPEFGLVEGFRGSAVERDDGTGLYAGFEDWFRGSEQTIADRQQAYMGVLVEHFPVLDVGCGRGELLELLAAAGVPASGVDIDPAMVARCEEKGLDVRAADAVEALNQVEEGSLGAVFAAQVVEHLPYQQLTSFLAAARRALRDDGLLIAETVNPHSPQGLKLFWVDPTHQHPLYPETMLALCYFSGYRQAFCWYPQGSGDPEADRVAQRDYALIARPL